MIDRFKVMFGFSQGARVTNGKSTYTITEIWRQGLEPISYTLVSEGGREYKYKTEDLYNAIIEGKLELKYD